MSVITQYGSLNSLYDSLTSLLCDIDDLQIGAGRGFHSRRRCPVRRIIIGMIKLAVDDVAVGAQCRRPEVSALDPRLQPVEVAVGELVERHATARSETVPLAHEERSQRLLGGRPGEISLRGA